MGDAVERTGELERERSVVTGNTDDLGGIVDFDRNGGTREPDFALVRNTGLGGNGGGSIRVGGCHHVGNVAFLVLGNFRQGHVARHHGGSSLVEFFAIGAPVPGAVGIVGVVVDQVVLRAKVGAHSHRHRHGDA